MDFWQRLNEAMDRAGIDQKQLARRLGAAEATVSDWFVYKRYPNGRFLAELPEILNEDGHWLLTGSRGAASVPADVAQKALARIAMIANQAVSEGDPKAEATDPVTDDDRLAGRMVLDARRVAESQPGYPQEQAGQKPPNGERRPPKPAKRARGGRGKRGS